MKQNKNLKIKLLQTLQRIKNLDLLPKEKDDLFSQTKPFELTPIKNDISSLDPINFINEDYNQAKLNPISLEENLEHNEHNNVNIKKIGNIEEISGVDKSILKNKTQNYQNEPKQIDIASKPAIFLIGEFPDSKEIIEKLNLRAEILKKSESNSRKVLIYY